MDTTEAEPEPKLEMESPVPQPPETAQLKPATTTASPEVINIDGMEVY